MNTLFISDLDGTLLNQSAELSDYAAEQLQQLVQEGLHFTVATARTWETVGKIMKNVDLKVPVILQNGVCVYDPGMQKYVKVHAIPVASVLHVIETMKKNRVRGFMYTIVENKLRTYYEELNTPWLRDFYEERQKKYDKEFRQVADFRDVVTDSIIYFSIFNTQEVLDPVYEAIKNDPGLHIEYYKDIYAEGLWYLEVNAMTASKAESVRFVKEYGKYDRVVVFGDNYNDLSMFKVADEKLAVGNARDAVKEAADQVIETNVEDGVVRYLKRRLADGNL